MDIVIAYSRQFKGHYSNAGTIDIGVDYRLQSPFTFHESASGIIWANKITRKIFIHALGGIEDNQYI